VAWLPSEFEIPGWWPSFAIEPLLRTQQSHGVVKVAVVFHDQRLVAERCGLPVLVALLTADALVSLERRQRAFQVAPRVEDGGLAASALRCLLLPSSRRGSPVPDRAPWRGPGRPARRGLRPVLLQRFAGRILFLSGQIQNPVFPVADASSSRQRACSR